jgi:hypothetical protein
MHSHWTWRLAPKLRAWDRMSLKVRTSPGGDLKMTTNDIDVPTLFWGCHWAGGVVSPANPAFTADELKYQLTIAFAPVSLNWYFNSSAVNAGLAGETTPPAQWHTFLLRTCWFLALPPQKQSCSMSSPCWEVELLEQDPVSSSCADLQLVPARRGSSQDWYELFLSPWAVRLPTYHIYGMSIFDGESSFAG